MPNSTTNRSILMLATIFSGLYLPVARVLAQSVSQYYYDSQGRLIAVRQGEGVASSYTFDAASNRSQVSVTLQFATAWAATSPSIGHIVGRSEADGWSARVEDPEGHVIFGPYTNGVAAGNHVAAFRILVDNNTANNSPVVFLDVWDATTSSQIAARQLTRMEWAAAGAYQVFEVPFVVDQARVGHAFEFRVYYQRTSYVRVQKVGYR